ncbi:MAG: glycogen debranching N-terminal domain-containing protein [Microbacteriaceae bacterium]
MNKVQPLLHDQTLTLCAPTQVWSGDDSELGEQPIHGVYHSDTRILSRRTVRVGGERPLGISHSSTDATTAQFVCLLRGFSDGSADPKTRFEVHRRVRPGRVEETLTITTSLTESFSTELELELGHDFSPMQAIKAGITTASSEDATKQPITTVRSAGIRWQTGSITAEVAAPGATLATTDAGVTLRWPLTIPARGSASVTWDIAMDDTGAVVAGAEGQPEWADFSIHAGDTRVAGWIRRGLDDLSALRMTTTRVSGEEFLAAGAPWFFTLFGRDSLWAARFLLPVGTGLAASTLRLLAALQGTRTVAETAEQPGKILHEFRSTTLHIPGENLSLPPLYFGTIDATPLWVNLLYDAWRWGMPAAEVKALLPNLEAALGWMRDYGDSDGDGFLEYIDGTRHGLANQGWKDSGDSIQWQDGTLAEGPIALCEVQGYAYEAAINGAALLEHFGRDGSSWREWAAELKRRFAEAFWIDSPGGRYPAVALDAGKRRVDTLTSNIGHLLGTGILDKDQSRLVADRLLSAELNSGYGLRTMSTDSAGYWPLSYHGGSVWTHDTAIAIIGLGRAGLGAEAAQLIDGLLAAAEAFDYRMPELHSGDAAEQVGRPVPYPAACRPQAWSAASAVAVLATMLGLEPNAGGELAIRPLPLAQAMTVTGLRFAGRPFSLSTDAAGAVTVSTLEG